MSRRVLLTVSGTIPGDLAERVTQGCQPRPDYMELARAFDADVLDLGEVVRTSGRSVRLAARWLGVGVALAWVCFRRRHSYQLVVTDGEQVGLPLAALLRLFPSRRPQHVMIAHLMSVRKKAVPFRTFRLAACIDRMIVYASCQADYVVEALGYPRERIVLTPFMVDSAFFAPVSRRRGDPPLVVSAGLEFRDYPTLLEAVRDLDVRVVLAAASPWSRRRDTTGDTTLPPNVEVRRLNLADLRALYTDADLVVVPVVETMFQAGITTILEAMSMGKPVLCTRTLGQTDTVIDDETGVYVPPGDAAAMRSAILSLLDDAGRAARLGAAARRWVEQHADIEVYAHRLADVVIGELGAVRET